MLLGYISGMLDLVSLENKEQIHIHVKFNAPAAKDICINTGKVAVLSVCNVGISQNIAAIPVVTKSITYAIHGMKNHF